VLRKVLPLAGSIAVIGANSMALSPIAGTVSRSFRGESPSDVVQAAGVYGLATAMSALTLAPAIDKIGCRSALLRSMLALTVGLIMSAVATNLWILCSAQALAGLAAGCALPAIYTLSSHISEDGRERETLGLVLTGWTVSLVLGVSLSAILADLVHWRYVFSGLAVVTGCLLISIHRSRELSRQAEPGVASSPLTAARAPGIAPLLLAVIAYMTAFYGFYTYLGSHLTEVLRLSTALAGVAPAAYGIGFGIAALADPLLDRHDSNKAVPLVLLGLGLIYTALAVMSASAIALTSICLALGFANHIGLNLIVSRLAALDRTQRGAIMGLYSAATYLAASVGAFLYRPIFEQIGFAGCALASALLVSLAVALSLRFNKKGLPSLSATKGD
jgi:MFS transporter, DHA1 family, inner membrane transport protein